MRLLDLFCGAGGAATGYARAGFEVVGVDIEPQPNYPFEFVQADALGFPLDGFDLVHASPPCQAFTAYKRRPNHVLPAPNLIVAIRHRLLLRGVPYVIENVPGAPLDEPIQLCGSAFGLGVRRHRFFESSLPLWASPCAHGVQQGGYPPASNRANRRRTAEIGVWRIPLTEQQEAMGIDWMNLVELSEAIPPIYTEFIGSQAFRHLSDARRRP